MLLFFGCEYETHDNNIELTKPDEQVEMAIRLNVENDGESILLWNERTVIEYDFTAGEHPPFGCVFSMGDFSWEVSGASGRFTLQSPLTQGDYTLKCTMYARTGSGSIAEQVGMEWYTASYSWPIKVMRDQHTAGSVKHRVNADGYLELSWDKFPISEDLFDGYTITEISPFEPKIVVSIPNVNQLSYAFKSYVGQQARFQVVARVKGRDRPWVMGNLDMETYDINLTCDYSRPDSVVVRWHNPFKAAVAHVYNSWDETLKLKTQQKEFCLPYADFGGYDIHYKISMETLTPVVSEQWDPCLYWFSIRQRSGELIAPKDNWARIGYNPIEDVLYVSSYGESLAWQCPALTQLGSYNGSRDSNVSVYALSQHTPRMGAAHDYTVDIYEGKAMQQVKTIRVNPDCSLSGTPTLTKDGKLVVFVHTYEGYKAVFYSAETGDMEAETSLPYSLGRSAYMTTDGVYILGEFNGEIMVCRMNGSTVSATYQLALPTLQGWCINPSNSEDLFVSTGSEIRRYRCRDLSLVSSWPIQDMQVGNVDPKSGYLLIYGYKTMHILDSKTGKIVYSMPISPSVELKLYGNLLVSNLGYALNLEKELSK